MGGGIFDRGKQICWWMATTAEINNIRGQHQQRQKSASAEINIGKNSWQKKIFMKFWEFQKPRQTRK